jgi:hypothetical protein
MGVGQQRVVPACLAACLPVRLSAHNCWRASHLEGALSCRENGDNSVHVEAGQLGAGQQRVVDACLLARTS